MIPNPYAGMSPSSRAAWFDVDTEPSDGDIEAFDRMVLPVLLDPPSFLAMPPLDRLRATVDYVTVHPEKHDQSVWTSTEIDPGADVTELAGPVVQAREECWCGDCGAPRAVSEYSPLRIGLTSSLSCGTSACLAGWGAMFAGALPAIRASSWDIGMAKVITGFPAVVAELRYRQGSSDATMEMSRVLTLDGAVMGVSEYAAGLFDLDRQNSATLFADSNDLAYLRELVADIERAAAE